MHHIGDVFEAKKLDGRPWAGYCSCGTQGDFITKGEAEGYLQMHFARIGLANTSEIVYTTPKVVSPFSPVAAATLRPPTPPAPGSAPKRITLADVKPSADTVAAPAPPPAPPAPKVA
jgi:hypothetical protein